MLVKTIEHAKRVFGSIRAKWARTNRRYLVFDTETRAIRPFPSDDALTIGRSELLIWSLCYEGVSYSFPTSRFSIRYPSLADYGDLLNEYFLDPTVCLVAHNWNYDSNVCFFNMGLPTPKKMWCTYIGAWMAAEYQPKGLKDRAPLLGRFLRETKTIDFSNERELSEYAEQDVVATEELYLLQRYGEIKRTKELLAVGPSGLVATQNEFYRKPFTIEEQCLSQAERNWLTHLEFPVLRSTIRAEQRGFPFDFNCLLEIRKAVVAAKKEALKHCFQAAGIRFNPRSGKDLTKIVENLGIEYPFKTKTGKLSFKEDKVQQMVEHHPIFRHLIEHSGLAKLVSVYIGSESCNTAYNSDCGLERWINPQTGAIHASAGTVEAITGRGSSSRPNLQQIPSRRDRFGVRRVFVATPVPAPYFDIFKPKFLFKRVLGVLDYSQLELRIMCLYSKDKAMTKVLCDPKGDIHQHTADEFGVSRDPHAKNLNFLLIFGGRARMLAGELTRMGAPTDVSTAQSYVDRHGEVYPGVKAQREAWCAEHQRNGRVRLFLGRYRTVPEADWSNEYGTHRAETRISNNAVQGGGQDFLKGAIIRSDLSAINPDAAVLRNFSDLKKEHRLYLKDRVPVIERYRKLFRSAQCYFLLQVHDEIIFSMVPSAAEECIKALADIMSWRHFLPGTSDYNLPLVAEGGVGPNWKAAKAKDALYHVKAGYEHWENYR